MQSSWPRKKSFGDLHNFFKEHRVFYTCLYLSYKLIFSLWIKCSWEVSLQLEKPVLQIHKKQKPRTPQNCWPLVVVHCILLLVGSLFESLWTFGAALQIRWSIWGIQYLGRTLRGRISMCLKHYIALGISCQPIFYETIIFCSPAPASFCSEKW